MPTIAPFLPLLCALCAAAPMRQDPSPRPATDASTSASTTTSTSAEERAWIEAHARAADAAFLEETLRAPKALVIQSVAGDARSAALALECAAAAHEREGALLVCLPTSLEEGRALDEYVRDGKGDPGQLLESDGLAPLLGAEHGLVAALRQWNADPARKHELRVAGIDYRRTRDDALALSDFAARVEPGVADRLAQLLAPFRQIGADGRHRYASCEESWRGAVQQTLGDLEEQSTEKRDEWRKLAGADGLQRGLAALARLLQAEAEVSRPKEFRRVRALGENALAARTALGLKADLVLCAESGPGMDPRDLHVTLGPDALSVLVLGRAGADAERDALVALRPGGALDLRALAKEQREGQGLLALLARRAELVLWDCGR